MYPGVELRLYRYVVVLAEELNFTRAALRLHVAQPSLSKQIRQLEDYLGAQVFQRTKREVRLTAAGEAFTAEAQLTLLHADRAVMGARAAKGQHKGPWSIGSSPLIEPRFGEDLNRIFGVARIRPRVFHEATTQAEALELVSEGATAALIMPAAQYPARDRIVFRRFVDEFLTAETALAYLGTNDSPILGSLKKFLFETFRPLHLDGIGGLRDTSGPQMNLFSCSPPAVPYP